MSMSIVGLPDPEPTPSGVDELRLDSELPNDVTQPMDAPSGTAAPFSGEHPQHRLQEERGQRTWWAVGAVVGALTLLLGAVGWLAHRHIVLVAERDRLAGELLRWGVDRAAWDRDRLELERVRQELHDRTTADLACQRRVDEETKTCKDTLSQIRGEARTNADSAAKYREEVNAKANELAVANSKLDKLKIDLSTLAVSKENAEKLYRDEQQRTVARDEQTRRELASLKQQAERLSLLCKGLQSGSASSASPGGYRPPPKECQGIK